MRAAVAVSQDASNPLAGLVLQQVPDPVAKPGWVKVRVKASSVNMHDVWTLRGVGHDPKNIPIILGCDVAGVTEDGREVIIHPVIADANAGEGDETLDPNRALLSEQHDGGFAQYIVVPERCVLDKPASLSFEEAACLPVAWSTAYRMLFTQGQLRAGQKVLVQGAGGGVASAAITLANAAGATVYATSRSAENRALALELGAAEAFSTGDRLPERVDLVIETVGEATWAHSLRCLKPGGAIVIAGATSGTSPEADLGRIFYHQLRVIGSTGSTREETAAMVDFVERHQLRPVIDRVHTLDEIHLGFQAMIDGGLSGKVVIAIP
ncbi:D-arabinose 1-dehydrogenase-like Zn-dependent alcohol dehydrogenase [Glutamicibacter mysorens]|uniref:D-arabinose 1-dehydrogenase-like Zn-dependent alcohol dehydrogenase n=1 Tax=Glutamicibacter mysorens TaxID=257984 RepID=A0ABX4N025_9MICC|nr:zinc-binding dehydrogenase [Glutamicibacter mysorens]PJJ44867.1 D-arabinose 1-dehydrogenase-like Zn-dependent alcohol dehydrogenase [Glutamicibacter mysorens]